MERFSQRQAGGNVRLCLGVSAGEGIPAGQPCNERRPQGWDPCFQWGLVICVLSEPSRVLCTRAGWSHQLCPGPPMGGTRASGGHPVQRLQALCVHMGRGRDGSHLYEQLLLCDACREQIRDSWVSPAPALWSKKRLHHCGLDLCPPHAPLSLHR